MAVSQRPVRLNIFCPHVNSWVVALLGFNGEDETISLGTVVDSAAHCLAPLGPRVTPSTEPIIYEGIKMRTPAAMQQVEAFATRYRLDIESLLKTLDTAIKADSFL